MNCVAWISNANCSDEQILSMKIVNSIFFGLCVIKEIVLLISVLRRYLKLNENINNFIIISAQLLTGGPFAIIYFSLYFSQQGSNFTIPISLFYWLSYIPCGTTLPSLVITWIEVILEKKLTIYPLIYILVVVLCFGSSAIFAAIAGMNAKWFNIFTRLILSNWALFLIFCIVLLLYGGQKIKNKLQKTKELTSTNHIIKNINRLIAMTIFVLIPACLALGAYAILLDQIDNSIVGTLIIQILFRICDIIYTTTWSVLFWRETNFKIQSRSESSSRSRSKSI